MAPKKKYKFGEVRDMAAELGYNRIYLSSVLSGKRIPSVKLAQALARATGEKIWKYRPDLKDIIIDSL